MKTRRHIVHTSFQMEADFLAYYRGDKLIALVVEGSDLPVNGQVNAATFKALLKAVRAKEKTFPDLWKNKRVPTYREPAGYAHDAVLPHANMRDVMIVAHGRYERRWISGI